MKRILSRDVWVMAALTLLCVVVYGRCVTHEHVLYDDPNIIFENEQVMAGLTWDSITWAITKPNFGLYMPLPTLTFLLDRELFGNWAGGYHGMTLLWHILCVCLFYWVMRRLTGNFPAALAAAILVAVHPVQAMTVNWISARNEIMPAVFMLLSVEMYRRYCGTRNGEERKDREENCGFRKQVLFYGLSVGGMFLGIMSKQGIVMLPVVLLMLDYWPLGRIEISFRVFGATLRRATVLVVEKLPWFAVSGLGAVFAVYGKRDFGAFEGETLLSPAQNIGFALTAFARYLYHIVYPERYIMAYSASGWNPAWWMIGGSALLLFTLTALALWQLWRRPWIIVFWGWFVCFLLPVSGLVRYAAESIALRYLYAPGMGLYLLAGFGLYELTRRIGQHRTTLDGVGQKGRDCPQRAKRDGTVPDFGLYRIKSDKVGQSRTAPDSVRQNQATGMFWAATAVLVVVSSGLAFRQSRFWKDSETLAQRALAVTGGENAMAHNHLGVIRNRQGLRQQGFAHLQKCMELEPERNMWRANYATALNQLGRYNETLTVVKPILDQQPDSVVLLNLYGGALTGLLRFEEAMGYLERALAIEPRYVPSLYNYGVCLQHTGRKDEARDYFERALEVQPTHQMAKKALEEL
ncbi:MAG: tetratricopeptide repeat protein [Candidatus Hydrogenedentes bacterium]|nr:tetratricopeptide repeat protein [Candidatus Hydrogenedentota bacterium]